MQIHQLQRKTPLKKSRQVGRGGKRGKTSGRGTKGQGARAGHKMRPEWRDQIKKIPKLRGYRFKTHQLKPTVINLAALDATFPADSEITRAALLARRLISKKSGRLPQVKILGDGILSKALKLKGLAYSASARQKVEAVGGSVS